MAGLQSLYTSASTQVRHIKFVPATRPDKAEAPEGIELIHLNTSPLPTTSSWRRNKSPSQGHDVQKEGGEMPRGSFDGQGPAKPSMELYPEADVKRQWSAMCRVGAGLKNLGNTCFMNSVLQCLTHTPPLAEALLHQQLKQSGGLSMLQLTQDHIRKALQGKHSVMAPYNHFKSMRRICRSFRLGRQEDAHEYLIGLLDAMHEGQLQGLKPKPSRSIQETSMIFRMFAGRIRSQVKCIECGFESNTVDPFLDISLEINRAGTLEKALQRFTDTEYLEGENKYKCPRQACLVRAAKRIAIETAPNVLVIQFKRFEFSMYGQKIAKKVDFETTLDMAPYMSDRRSSPKMYQLYGVLVHQGHSVHSGHYYCFVRAANGLWHQMNDHSVSQVSERIVLAQKAYILFYIRKDEPVPSKEPASPRNASWPAHTKNKSHQPGNPAQQPASQYVHSGNRSQTQANPPPTAKRKRAERDQAEQQSGAPGHHAAPGKATKEKPQAADAGTPHKHMNGGPDPTALLERLQSHAEASPSSGSYKSALDSPSSLEAAQPRDATNRKPLAAASAQQQSTFGSPSRALRKVAAYLSTGKRGRSFRRFQGHLLAGSKLRSAFSKATSMTEKSAPRNSPQSSDQPVNGSLKGGSRLPSRLRPRQSETEPTATSKGLTGALDQKSVGQLAHSAAKLDAEGEKKDLQRLANGVASDHSAEGEGGLPSKPSKSKGKAKRRPARDSEQQPISGAKLNAVGDGKQPAVNGLGPQLSQDPTAVAELLGLKASSVRGPGGEEHWDTVSTEARREADAFLKSLESEQPAVDEYNLEYDRGKTKKIKGMGQQNSWNDAGDNRFQNAWNSRSTKSNRPSEGKRKLKRSS